MSHVSLLVFGVLVAIGVTFGHADAAGDPVPVDMQGVWAANGRCDVLKDRLTIKARKAGWGKKVLQGVSYDAKSSAVYWDQEGIVDNFVHGSTPQYLIHNTQGFNMLGDEALVRCGARLTRERLPSPKDFR